LKGVQLQHK